MKRLALLVALTALTACSFQNHNEREADRVTRAVIANDMRGVANDFDAPARDQITRVRVAELSDELNAQGAYQGLKQDQTWCRPGYLCFDVTFKNRPYYEWMKLDSDGKIQEWRIRDNKPAA